MEIIENNNKEILTEWVSQYSDELYNWAYHKLDKKEIAKDMVQDTFFIAFKKIHTFKKESSAKTWLFSILKNKVFEFYRNKYKQSTISINKYDYLIFNEKGNWIDNKNSTWTDNSNIFDNLEFNRIFKLCLDGLPNNWKMIVKLKYIENQKSNDICEELKIS